MHILCLLVGWGPSEILIEILFFSFFITLDDVIWQLQVYSVISHIIRTMILICHPPAQHS